MKKNNIVKVLLLLALILMGAGKLSAQEAYAIFNNGTLTFYYDSESSSRTGTKYSLNAGSMSEPAWYSNRTSVTSVVFDDSFEDARPTTTSQWFRNMTNLTSITNLNKLNTSQVTSMYLMFSNCSRLTSLDVSNFDTSNVTNMQSLFYGLSGLTSLDLSSFDTQKVTIMYSMFNGCTGMPAIDIRSFNTSAVANMMNMFANCSNLTTVYVGHEWSTASVTSSGSMFYNCAKLVGGAGTTFNSSYLDATYAHVDGGTSNPGYFTRVPYAVYTSSNRTLTFYDDGAANSKSGTIYNLNTGDNNPGWKSLGSNIQRVVFSESFAVARPTTTYMWFGSLFSLSSITDINYLNTSSVTDMRYMFQNCFGLTTLDLSHWNTENVTLMNGMFQSCRNLTTLDLTGWNTAKVTNMVTMFNDCPVLTTIYVNRNWSTVAVTGSVSMFSGCTQLVGGNHTAYNTAHTNKLYARIDEPGTPGYLTMRPEPYAVYTSANGGFTFYYDIKRSSQQGETYLIDETADNPLGYNQSFRSSVSHVLFDPSFASYRPQSMRNWFRGMSNLTAVNGIQYLNTSEVDHMAMLFYGCSALTSLDLSNFDTSKVLALGYMFYGCSALTSLDLSSFKTPKVVDTSSMFGNCVDLETIYVGSGWDMSHLNSHSGMFSGCTSLVGGAGTAYNSSYTNKTYARVDGGTSNPGYLTSASAREAYAEYENGTLTFYYDSQRSSRTGTTYNLNTGYNFPEWGNDATRVLFDPSFANARPTSTYCWFANMSNLESIDGLLNLNTSEVTNMSRMFDGCSKLEYIEVGSFNTAKVTDMGSMFMNCQKVRYLNVGNWNTSNVTNMNNLFNSCYVVESLNVSGWDTHNVTDMNGMFSACYELTALDVSYFDTRKVVNMSFMFSFLPKVTHLDVSHFDTSNLGIKGMDYMFDGCNSLTSLDLSSFTTSGLTSLTYVFENCSSLTSLSVNHFDVSNVEEFYGTFHGCSSLTSLDLTNWNTSKATNMMYLFSYCESLTSIDLSHFNTSNVTKMSYMFNRCMSLTSLDVSSLNTSNVQEFANMFYQCVNLQSLDVSTFDTRNAVYMGGMFGECKKLPSLNLDNFNTEKVTNMSSMFRDCESLSSLQLGNNFTTDLVTNMESMFSGCKALTEIDLSHFNTPAVERMRFMFYGCSSLEYIDLSNFNTSNVRFMESLFQGCSAVKVIDITGWDISQLMSSELMFASCPALTTIYADDWDVSNLHNSMMMFVNDLSLVGEQGTRYYFTEDDHMYEDYIFAHIDKGSSKPGVFSNKPYVVFNSDSRMLTFYADDERDSRSGLKFNLNREHGYPDWIGYTSYIETVTFDPSFAKVRPFNTDNWFYTLNNLHTINGIENLNTSEVTNMSSMFGFCTSLTSLDLSYFDTRNVTDMNYMFFGSNNLETIFVGEGWNVDGVVDSDRMFASCSSLVGGNGTTYDANHTDKEYARIDGIDGYIGYLTGAEIYAIYTSTDHTLTFYFDGQRSEHTAGQILLPRQNDYPEWYEYKDNINHVVFDPSFANARPFDISGWFNGLSHLTDISGMEFFNTSNTLLMDNLFYSCSSLQSIDLSKFDTSSAVNTSGMFGYCSSLTSIDVSNFDVSNVSKTVAMFFGCTSLTTIKGINEWNTPMLEQAGGMFRECTSLTSIDLSGWKTDNLDDIVEMFFGCSKLTSLKLSNWNTQSLATMSMTFRGCSSLTSLDLSGWNTQNVSDMTDSFAGCSSLKTIYVGNNWSTSSVTSDSNMFYGCSSLVGGAGTTFSSSHIDKSYAHVDGGTSNPGYMTKRQVYVAFNADTHVLTFCNDDQYSTRPGIKFYINEEEDPSWHETTINLGVNRVVFEPSFADVRPTTLQNWFSRLDITEVEGIEYLNTSQVTSMEYMFDRCSHLQHLDVSGFDVRNVKTMYGLFNNCSQLENVDVSSWNTDSLEIMQQVFYGCSAMTEIDLENWNTEKVTSAAHMFNGCTNLTTIYVGDKWDVTSDYNDMFTGCTSLVGGAGTTYDASHTNGLYAHVDGGTENPGYLTQKPQMYAVYSNINGLTFYYDTMKATRVGNVYELNEGSELPGWYTDGVNQQVRRATFDSSFSEARPTTIHCWFAGMDQLTSVNNLSFLNSSAVTDMSYAFAGCSKLRNFIPSTWNTENVTNMASMFQDCTSIEQINLSTWNTSNVTNFATMFAGCSALTTILIGPGWSTESNGWVNNNMFDGCTSLVGSAGTVYDPNHTDHEYAHVDGGTSNPGYLSMKPYAILDFDNKTLTFYCDGLRYTNTHPGAYFDLNKEMNDPYWLSYDIEKVVFDPSFVNARPTTTYEWFFGMSNLTEIVGLNYLNTSEVENMISMFEQCASLETIDISNFTTEKLKWITQMFNCCSKLTTIYAGEGWSMQNAEGEQVTGSLVFGNDNKLKGGAGTTYRGGNEDDVYAHIDGGTSNPGYFTLKPSFKQGDVNMDGAVNVSDVTMLVSMILGNTAANAAADVNGDSSVNVSDVTALVSIILGQH